MENQDFGKSYVVLYKIGGFCTDEPNICRGTFQVQSYVVLYKISDAAPPIPLQLPLTVAPGGFRMRLPIVLLIAGVLGLPLLLAVTDYLRIQRISSDLLSVVVGAATALAFGLTANALPESVR